jgi:hypothetical protein
MPGPGVALGRRTPTSGAPEGLALYLQRSCGNAAVSAVLGRAPAAGTDTVVPAPAPAHPAGRQGTLEARINGLRDTINVYKSEHWRILDGAKEISWVSAISWTSSLLAGALPPEIEIWDAPESLVQEARTTLANGSEDAARRCVVEAEREALRARQILSDYRHGVEAGAGRAIFALRVSTKAGSGAAEFVGAAVGGEAGGMAAAGVYGAAQETASQYGGMLAGDRKKVDFDVPTIIFHGSEEVIFSWTGHFLEGTGSKQIAATIAYRIGVEPAHVARALISSKPAQLAVKTAVESFLHKLREAGTGDAPRNEEDFADKIVSEITADQLIECFAEGLTEHVTP